MDKTQYNVKCRFVNDTTTSTAVNTWVFVCKYLCKHMKILSCAAICGFGDSPHKGQVEADGQLEVQLNCCTLVVASNCIFDLNVNLKQRQVN